MILVKNKRCKILDILCRLEIERKLVGLFRSRFAPYRNKTLKNQIKHGFRSTLQNTKVSDHWTIRLSNRGFSMPSWLLCHSVKYHF